MNEVGGPNIFGHSKATVTFEEVARSLTESQRLLAQLLESDRRVLSIISSPSNPMRMHGGPPSQLELALMVAKDFAMNPQQARTEALTQMRTRDAITDREAEIVSEAIIGRGGFDQFQHLLPKVIIAVKGLGKKYDRQEKASGKPNYRAAAVAHGCRFVWGEEHLETDAPDWQKFCAAKGKDMDQISRIYDFAPKSQKEGAGPFGRFLEDINEAMGIFGKGGGVVSAMVALRCWRSLSSQEIKK